MNVQISPLQTPPVRDAGPDDDESTGRGRTWLIGGEWLDSVYLELRPD